MAHESFALPTELSQPVQRILNTTLDLIACLEKQIAKVEGWIADELGAYPAIQQLTTIPGIGPACSAGIAAEINPLERFLGRHQVGIRAATANVPRICATPKTPSPRSPDSGGPSRSLEASKPRIATCPKAGNTYLRYYFVMAAEQLRLYEPAYRRYYQRKYAETATHKHKRALVLTARKSVGLIVGLLHRNEPYRSLEGPPHLTYSAAER